MFLIMFMVFVLLLLASLIVFPIGLVKPSLVMRKEGVSRKKFGVGMLGAILFLFIASATTAPKTAETKDVKGSSTTNSVEATPTPGEVAAEIIAASTQEPTPTVVPTNTPAPTKAPTPTPKVTKIPTPTTPASSGLSNDNTYTNSEGNTVQSPAYSNDGSVPAGATARCGDGTYSFSQSRRGTCSHHGGVAQWL